MFAPTPVGTTKSTTAAPTASGASQRCGVRHSAGHTTAAVPTVSASVVHGNW